MRGKGMVKGVAIASVMACMLATKADAYITINWQTLGPWLQYGTTWTGSNLDDIVPVGSLIQLIWSADEVMDPLNAGNAMPTGDDILLASHNYQGAPTYVGGLNAQTYYAVDYGMNDTTFHAGHVYVRAFDVAAPTLGDHYLQGGWVQNLTANPGNPDQYNDAQLIPGGNPLPVDMTIVPEPGTFALFGVGLAAIIAKRKLRK